MALHLSALAARLWKIRLDVRQYSFVSVPFIDEKHGTQWRKVRQSRVNLCPI